jgi:molecular chaperone DnaK (HSP70)
MIFQKVASSMIAGVGDFGIGQMYGRVMGVVQFAQTPMLKWEVSEHSQGHSTGAAGPIVGIDLGTTNSLIAVSGWPRASDGPRVVREADGREHAGEALLPSVVRFEADGAVVVGTRAKAEAPQFPRTTIASVKRLMGRSLRDAGSDVGFVSYEVVQGPGQTARVRLPAPLGRDVSPQEVSAHVLRALRARAEAGLGVKVERAVITVPAYFDDAQRQATRDAARLSGLEAVRLVAEPTAAALAYGLGVAASGLRRAQTMVVYDLGGGTFDVSVLRLTPRGGGADAFEVLSTAGDTHLGGDDVDFAVMRWLVERAIDMKPDLPAPSDAARRRLLAEAERAKIRLSDDESIEIDLAWLVGADGPASRATLTRSTLEGLCAGLIDRTIAACRRALRDARDAMDGQGVEGVDAVILVGGATRMPVVRRRVAEFFGREPYTAIDPDQAVALGAAVQASVIASEERRTASAGGAGSGTSMNGPMLLDVIPLSLGLETAGGGVAKIIMRNTPVPARASEMFSTQKDGQGSILLNIVQGEREMAVDCRSLGTFHLRGIPPMPAGLAQLRVDFVVDVNGILSVEAVEQRSQRRLRVQIVPNHGLTREEVHRIERESFAFAREDMARHRIADLIANSELDAGWIRTQLARYGTDVPAELRGAIEAALEALEGFITRAKADWQAVVADEFARAKESLDRASMPLHEAAMTRSLRQISER